MKTAAKLPHTKPEIAFITLACCTCSRPGMLERVLHKIKTMNLPEGINIELLIIDNDKELPARGVVEKLQKDFPIKINYYLEETRGIAVARNRLLREAINMQASHVALFDDDGLIEADWLINHIKYYRIYQNAYVISGPQYTWFDGEFPGFITRNNIFKCDTSKEKGEIIDSCATNNVFFPVEIIKHSNIWFDEKYGFMGGEDGDFFSRMTQNGYTIVFNPESIVKEVTDKTRANISWILSRSYFNGYTAAFWKLEYNNDFGSRFKYTMKALIILSLDCMALPFSILGGPTLFLNVLAITAKTLGKLMGCLYNKKTNYYEKVICY